MNSENRDDHFYDDLLKKNKISERGELLLESGAMSDCLFRIASDRGEKEFKAHKLILCMSSPVFHAMFHSSLEEEHTKVVEISDVQPEAFAALLRYIYTDKLELKNVEQACEICYAAKKYMMHHVVEQCIDCLWKDLNISNVCKAYQFAYLYDHSKLMESCMKILCDQTSAVLKQPDFVNVESCVIDAILDQSKLSVTSELEIFKAIFRWLKEEAVRKGMTELDEKRKLAEPYLRKVRFASMTPKEFADGPGGSDLLPPEISLAMLMAIASPSNVSLTALWPAGWSTLHRDLQRPQLTANNPLAFGGNTFFANYYQLPPTSNQHPCPIDAHPSVQRSGFSFR